MNKQLYIYDEHYIIIEHIDSHRQGGIQQYDGYAFTVHDKPFITPATTGVFKKYETFGVEEPRISCITGAYYITYSAYSKNGVHIGLAKTKYFKFLERISLITEADYRNVVLFPEKINGRYIRLDRPHSEIYPWAIWISIRVGFPFITVSFPPWMERYIDWELSYTSWIILR